jgi:hypothetical protein
MKKFISIATLVALLTVVVPVQAEINKAKTGFSLPSIFTGIYISMLGYLIAAQAQKAEISFKEFIGKQEVKEPAKSRQLYKVRRNAVCCIGATIGLALLNRVGKNKSK